MEPDPWMSEVSAVGHGTRKVQPMSKGQTLRELVASALRTREGITRHLWFKTLKENFLCADSVTLEMLVGGAKCEEFLRDGYLILDSGGLRLSGKGIAVADYLTVYVIGNLEDVLEKSEIQAEF